jgi:hypothetical protein
MNPEQADMFGPTVPTHKPENAITESQGRLDMDNKLENWIATNADYWQALTKELPRPLAYATWKFQGLRANRTYHYWLDTMIPGALQHWQRKTLCGRNKTAISAQYSVNDKPCKECTEVQEALNAN